jgi:hypothetical protein
VMTRSVFDRVENERPHVDAAENGASRYI